MVQRKPSQPGTGRLRMSQVGGRESLGHAKHCRRRRRRYALRSTCYLRAFAGITPSRPLGRFSVTNFAPADVSVPLAFV